MRVVLLIRPFTAFQTLICWSEVHSVFAKPWMMCLFIQSFGTYHSLCSIAKKILEKSPNVASIPGHGGLTALHFAALYDNVEILEDLLESVSNFGLRAAKIVYDDAKDGLTTIAV